MVIGWPAASILTTREPQITAKLNLPTASESFHPPAKYFISKLQFFRVISVRLQNSLQDRIRMHEYFFLVHPHDLFSRYSILFAVFFISQNSCYPCGE